MNEQNRCWGKGVVRRGVGGMCALVLVAFVVAGCRARQSGDATLMERISRVGHSNEALKPGELAEKGRVEITTECEKQSYETAKKGLIVSETGLHEDVFTLRDRVSYGAVGYSLDEAIRLEALLRMEAKVAGRPEEQTECIQRFAEHLETLSDPLVEADERQKELDVSAFNDAAKEAQEQADKKLREPVEPKAQQPE